MRDPLKVAIVGAGFAARFHLESWRRVFAVPVEIVGVLSRHANKAAALAAEFGTHPLPDWEAAARAANVFDICTPGHTHEALAVQALRAGKDVIVEKPFTGYYGDGSPSFSGLTFDRRRALDQVLASCRRLREAVRDSGRILCYAENWIYAPAVQKEREILEKSRGQILRLLGEESHSGSHAPSYGHWSQSGGGALASKGCHPLSAALYFKQVEGRTRLGRPIVPVSVSAHLHRLTQLPGYQDEGTLRTDYTDTEDYGQMHVTFDDGTVADIFASDVVLGGVANWIEVFAGNHRTRCNLNPVDALKTFAPGEALQDVYVVEKTTSKRGWSNPAPDENWMHGYPQELQAFAESLWTRSEPQSGIALGEMVAVTLQAAYLSAATQGSDTQLPPFPLLS